MAANQHGLEAHYFKEKLGLIVRDADNYTPGEMLRSLRALANVAKHQADQHTISQGKWTDLPTGTSGGCPHGTHGKRIAVRRRNGEIDVWEHAIGGPDFIHDGSGLDIVSFMLLEALK